MKLSGARILLTTALVSGGLAAVPAATAQAAPGTVAATHVKTTATGAGSTWDGKGHPSPDPSGVTYNSSTGNLIISDGEVEETNLSWHVWRGTNLYVASRGGTLLETGLDTMTSAQGSYSKEPTGVGFRPSSSAFPERLFVSDDDQAKIFEVNGVNGKYGDGDDRWTSSPVAFLNLGAENDAEDVAVNLDISKNGQLLLVDGKGKRAFLYNPGTDKVFNGSGDFVEKVIDLGPMGAGDPEGIAYNASRNTMFVLDDPSNRIYEVGLDGTLLNRITLPFTMKSGAGIALAPPSSSSSLVCGTSTSVACNAYIVDRGVDNDSNSSSFNDGRLYEIAIPGLTGGGGTGTTNTPPTANAGADQTITLPSSANLDGTVSDSTPTGTLTSLWTKVSGTGTVTFASETATDTTASFSTSGTYVLRLTASDGPASHSDDVQVVVNPSSTTGGGTTGTLDIPVRASTDDAEQRSASVVTSSGDLNLVMDGTTVQTVGMRFTGVTVPKGATIKNAWVQFQVDEVSTGASSLTIAGQAADNAATFAAVAGDLSTTNRPRTGATASWAPAEWPTVGARTEVQRTGNLASVVQEIVNRPGWASGNPVALIVTGSGSRIAESYDGGATKAPVLHIEW